MSMASDNVIRFPEGGRQAALDHDRALAETRDQMARRLREALRASLTKVQDDLARQGDSAKDRDTKNFFFGIREGLLERASRLEALLAAHWIKEFDAAVKGGASAIKAGVYGVADLKLMDDGDLDEEIAFKSLISALREACEDDLFAIARRMAVLTGSAQMIAEERNPASPDVLGKALRGALREADFPMPHRREILVSLNTHAVVDVPPVFNAINSHLLGLGLLPDLKRSFARPAASLSTSAASVAAAQHGVAPGAERAASASSIASSFSATNDIFSMLSRLVIGQGGQNSASGPAGAGGLSRGFGSSSFTASPGVADAQVWAMLDQLQRGPVAGLGIDSASVNSLREFRASPAGQSLDGFDAVTVDIVATLFDLIFADKEIPDAIKALVGRMQFPVLKVAMRDKSFFSSRAHPVRRLLDGISRAAVRWPAEGGHNDPLYRAVAGIVDRVQSEFAQDTALFETLCDELDGFLANDEKAMDSWVARAAPMMGGLERREQAEAAAAQALSSWLAAGLPGPVIHLLDREWRKLLCRCHLAGDEAGWVAAMKTAHDLVWSTEAKPDVRDRRTLASMLPSLVRRLQEGFDRVGVDADRRLELVDALFSLHAAVLRGAEAPVNAALESALDAGEPSLAADVIEADGLVVESFTLSRGKATGSARQRVDALQRGEWLEFRHEEGRVERYRLSWISPQRGVMLFTNPQSPRALSLTPAALAHQIERGEATLVSAAPIFERAVDRALEALQAA